MTELDLLAEEVNVSGRTLRRAAERGTIRTRRHGPRRISVSSQETDYVRKHWSLLEAAVEVLRTRPNVRLCVLFGSAARGELRSGSDVDVLVRQRADDWRERLDLAERLEGALGRPVQVVAVDAVSASLLADAVRDGRVLVDRDGDWRRLSRHAARIKQQAEAEEARLEREAWETLEHLEELLA
jgi:predicted nucleotidyltransferase